MPFEQAADPGFTDCQGKRTGSYTYPKFVGTVASRPGAPAAGAAGTLVVGDSHHRFATPEPFADERVDALILRHLQEALKLDRVDVVERWTGVYPTGAPVDCVIEAPDASTRVVVVTSGTGASTAFGIAEEVFDGWT